MHVALALSLAFLAGFGMHRDGWALFEFFFYL